MSETPEPDLPPFKPGVYQHFKYGDLYFALLVANDSEDFGKFKVLYYSLAKKRWRVRDYKSPETLPDSQRCGFFDHIKRPAYEGPRFMGPIDPLSEELAAQVRRMHRDMRQALSLACEGAALD